MHRRQFSETICIDEVHVDISKVFTERNIDINAIHSRTSKQGVATIDVSFGVSSKAELAELVNLLKSIESVIDIERTTG